MTNKTVLVIDTDTETIQKIMSGLETEGFLVFTASEKDVSIKMAKKINPSLIFVNIGMSGTSGLEICKAIHSLEALKDIPIIMITPHEGELDSRHKTVYGIVDTIKKPFVAEDVISKANSVITGVFLGAEAHEEELLVEPLEEDIAVEPEEDMDVTIVDQGRREVPLEEEEEEEEIEVMPFEEEVPAESVEDEFDVQGLEEERVEEPFEEELSEQPVEEELDTQFLEEEIEITPPQDVGFEPVEEEIDVQPFEEEETEPPQEQADVGFQEETGKVEGPEIIEEEMEEIHDEEVPEEISPDETELTQMLEEADMEGAKKDAPEEPVVSEEPVVIEETMADEEPMVTEEPAEVSEPAPSYKKRDNLYRGTRRRSSGKGSKVLIPVIIIALLIIVGGGFLVYNFFMKGPQVPVALKRERPVQKQPAQVQPSSEEQKGTTKQVEQKRKPATPTTPPAPATTVKPKTKQTPTHPTAPVTTAKAQTKLVYAVQLGAYKSKANADALVRKYTQKGYDAFTQKSTIAGKGTLYRVLIGKFDNKSKADQLARQIRSKENISTIIFHGKV